MINDIIFQIAAEHCLRVSDGSDPNNLDALKSNTIRTYHQLLEVYQAVKDDLKAKHKPSNARFVEFP